MKRYFVLILSFLFLPTLGFSLTLEDLKWLSNKDVRKLQLSLAQLGFEVGYADGVAGRKTLGAVSLFIEDNKLANDTLKNTLKKLDSAAKIERRKEIIHFYDDFSSKSLDFSPKSLDFFSESLDIFSKSLDFFPESLDSFAEILGFTFAKSLDFLTKPGSDFGSGS